MHDVIGDITSRHYKGLKEHVTEGTRGGEGGGVVGEWRVLRMEVNTHQRRLHVWSIRFSSAFRNHEPTIQRLFTCGLQSPKLKSIWAQKQNNFYPIQSNYVLRHHRRKHRIEEIIDATPVNNNCCDQKFSICVVTSVVSAIARQTQHKTQTHTRVEFSFCFLSD